MESLSKRAALAELGISNHTRVVNSCVRRFDEIGCDGVFGAVADLVRYARLLPEPGIPFSFFSRLVGKVILCASLFQEVQLHAHRPGQR